MSVPKTTIYAGGPLYPPHNETTIKSLGDSGFTTVVAFALHLTKDGDLVFNQPNAKLVSGDEYVGPSNWGDQLSTLKDGSVNELFFCIGGWETGDFDRLEHWISTDKSALRKKFAVLKKHLPAVDGIDLDDEGTYDKTTTTQFSKLLHDIGYDVTFCPYTRCHFWVECLKELNSETPNLVTGFNLQCYAGGRLNTPGPWIHAIKQEMGPDFDAKGFVFPGLWGQHGKHCGEGDLPDKIHQKLHKWKKAAGIEGAFLWLYDEIADCGGSAKAYAQKMRTALQG